MARSTAALLRRLARLAGSAMQGTLVEVYLRCGTKSCGCHRDPVKRHGPHLYLKYRDPRGRSTGMYIPREHASEARQAVGAWAEMWETIVALSEQNREALRERVRRRKDA